MKSKTAVVLVVIGLGWMLLAGCQARGNARVTNTGSPANLTDAAASQTLDQIQVGLQKEETSPSSSTAAAHDLEHDLDTLEKQLNQSVP